MIKALLCMMILMISGCDKCKNEKLFNKDEMLKSDNLMIVAHPDDETLWGGNHLMKESYYIVCLTNKDNDRRKKEFEKMLEMTNSNGVILDYPDKVNGEISNWENEIDEINEDLNYVINFKNWDKIVTHNELGEYGHIQHIMTNEITYKLTNNNLYVFEYHNTGNKYLTKEELSIKKNILSIYESQFSTITKFNNEIKYETFKKVK